MRGWALLGLAATLVVPLLWLASPAQAEFNVVGRAYRHSEDGVAWQAEVRQMPHGLTDVAYGGGVWVAVSNDNIWRSTDGITWTDTTPPVPAPTSPTFNWYAWTSQFLDVTYANGVFVIVGPYSLNTETAIVYVSSDGATWDVLPTGQYWLYYQNAVAYGNGLFVSVGDLASTMASADGRAWVGSSAYVGATTALIPELRGVAHDGAGLWVAVGASGTILTSLTGLEWVQVPSGTAQTLNSVTYGNGLWVVVGPDTVLTSPDGQVWTPRAVPTDPGITFQDVAFGDGRFVVVSNSWRPNATTYSATVLVSDDGMTWSSRPATAYYYYGPQGVAYGGGQWVAVGLYAIVRSPDGDDWIAASEGVGYQQNAMAYNGSTWVSVGNYGSVFTSPDGRDWTARYSGQGSSVTYRGVAQGLGAWVLVGAGGNIRASLDGVHWTPRASGTTSELRAVAHGPGQFIAVGAGGTILTSPDGQSWSQVPGPTSQALYGVAYGRDLWVAVGASGTILTSPDGVTWTPRSGGGSSALNAVSIDHTTGRWVAAGASGSIRRSTDGLSWTGATSGTTMALAAVAAQGGTFVAVGSVTCCTSAVTLVSTTTTSWSLVDPLPYQTQKWAVASDVLPPPACAPARQLIAAGTSAKLAGGAGQWPYAWSAPGSDDAGPTPGASAERRYNVPGNYTVTLRDAAGRQTTCLVDVAESPPPSIPVCVPALQSAAIGQDVDIFATGSPPLSWSALGSFNPGPVAGTLLETAYPSAGLWTVTVSNSFGAASCTVKVAPAPGCPYATEPTIPFDWTDISVTGTSATGGALQDDDYEVHPLAAPGDPPMSFTLCDSVATQVGLGSNGLLCLGAVNCACPPMPCNYPGPIPSPSLGRPAVFGYTADLFPPACVGGAAECVKYQTLGTAPNRVFVYSMLDVPHWSAGGGLFPGSTFQVKLFETTNCVEVHFLQVQSPGFSFKSLSGLQNAAGTTGWQYAHAANPGFSRTATAWRACPGGAASDTFAVREDRATTLDVLANDPVPPGGSLQLLAVTPPSLGQTAIVDGKVRYVPAADRNGLDSFFYLARDSNGNNVAGKVAVNLKAVNDAPLFLAPAGSIHVTPGQGEVVLPGWATDVRPGPLAATDEAGQAVRFEVASNTRPGAFAHAPVLERTVAAASAQPADPPTSGLFAVLRFTPAAPGGVANVCFRPVDDGGDGLVVDSNGGSEKGMDSGEPRCVTIVVNQPPITYFEPSASDAYLGQSVSFDPCPGPAPRCTFDPDGAIALRIWEFGDGTTSAAVAPAKAWSRPGTYEVRFTAWDDLGEKSSFVQTVRVAAESGPAFGGEAAPTTDPPIAEAGPDRTVLEESLVQLSGAQAGGGSGTFAWRQLSGPTVTLSDPTAGAPLFTAPRLADMASVDLVFALRVSEGQATSPSDYVVVHVVTSNHAPVANAGGTIAAPVGSTVTLDATQSHDADGDALSYSWQQLPRPGDTAVRLSDATAARPTFVAPDRPGMVHMLLTVSDGRASTQDYTTIEVGPQARSAEAPAASPPPEAARPAAVLAPAKAPPLWPVGLAVVAFAGIAALVALAVVRRMGRSGGD